MSIYGTNKRGNMLGVVRLVLPQKLDEDEVKILKELKARGRISMKKGCPRTIAIVQGKELI